MSRPRTGWRLFVRGRDSGPNTLYHAHIDGSKRLETDKWLTAVQRIGANPGKLTKTTKKFRTGWHIFPSLDALIKYCRHMDPDYIVCPVTMMGKIRPKPRSRSNVLLATQMKISGFDWNFLSSRLGDVLEGGEKPYAD